MSEMQATNKRQMSEMQAMLMAKMEALNNARVYASIDARTKSKSTASANISELPLSSLTLIKGKAGKLGRGSHGQVKVSQCE